MMDDKKRSLIPYGWVIVGVCFLTVAVSYGIRYSFPVLYVSILSEFGWNRADTALIFSINLIVYGVSAPLVGVAVDRLGPRKLMTAGAILLASATAACSLASQLWHFYVLFGVLVAFGICVTGYVPNTVLISRWFVKRRGTALGIYNLGFATAYAVAYPVEYMIGDIGWRSSFVALALLALIAAPLIAIFQRLDPLDKGLLPDGEYQEVTSDQARVVATQALVVDKKWASTDWNLAKSVRTRRFWFLFIGNLLLWGIAVNLMLAHQIAFAVDKGYSRSFGALIFGLYGVSFGLGNLVSFLSDRFGREVAVTAGLTVAIIGVLMLLLNRANYTPCLMYAYSLLFGIGIGIATPTFTASAADIFQGKGFGSIQGLMVAGFGIGGFISPWLGGKLFDVLGTYTPAFCLVMAALAGCVFCIWIAGPRHVRLVAGKASNS